MHCQSCGGPSYQNPCAACIGKTRSNTEQLAQAAPQRLSSQELQAASDVHKRMHALWTKSVGGHLYDKHEWDDFERSIATLCSFAGIPWTTSLEVSSLQSEEPTRPSMAPPVILIPHQPE